MWWGTHAVLRVFCSTGHGALHPGISSDPLAAYAHPHKSGEVGKLCLSLFSPPFSVACRLSVSPEDPHHRTQAPLSGKSGVSRQSGRFLFSFSTSVECHPSPPQSAFFSCTPFPIPHPLAPAPAMHQVLCCSYQGSFSGGVDPLSQEGPPEHLAAWSKDSPGHTA